MTRLRSPSFLVRLARPLAAVAFLAGLAACSSPGMMPTTLYPVPQVSAQDMVTANVAHSDAYKPAVTGSIYQSVQYRPLLEDHRARLVGDILTVNIVEKLSATQSSTTSIDKNGSISGSVSGVPFVNPSFLTKLGVGASSDNKSSGQGATQNTNDFTGTITSTVVQVLPNGHLLIRGEKQIGVNQNVDILLFTGQVDPHTIVAGNTVNSTQVANVRIQQSGRGAAADAQAMGWLSRFFLNLMPF